MGSKEFVILIERYLYTARTTIGRMYFLWEHNKIFFGYTLEDTVRPTNIKVYGETALPAMRYKVKLYTSGRFGDTIIFHTEDDGITIKVGLLKWEYALAHGGNDHEDTLGCVLVAKNLIGKDRIQGSLKDELRRTVEDKLHEGYDIYADIVNLSQVN